MAALPTLTAAGRLTAPIPATQPALRRCGLAMGRAFSSGLDMAERMRARSLRPPGVCGPGRDPRIRRIFGVGLR